jgi:hypothetical protein
MGVGSSTTRRFVDGIIYTTPSVESSRPSGCEENDIYVDVPSGLPVGRFSLEILYRYKVNPLRSIDVIKRTEPFAVIK